MTSPAKITPDPAKLRAVADQLAALLHPGMANEKDPAPETLAAWQASIALERIAEALAAPDQAARTAALHETVARGEYLIGAVHDALVADHTLTELAGQCEDQRQASVELRTEAVVSGGTIIVELPSEGLAAMDIDVDPDGVTRWKPHAADDLLLPPTPADARAQLDIAAAFRLLSGAITQHLHPADLEEDAEGNVGL